MHLRVLFAGGHSWLGNAARAQIAAVHSVSDTIAAFGASDTRGRDLAIGLLRPVHRDGAH
jgi:hypothetical protein